jgi:toxin-antitoxin system PIN domain toxin
MHSTTPITTGIMVLADVNVLVSAFRPELEHSELCRGWLTGVMRSDHAYGVSDLSLAAMVRVVTNPRAFSPPDSVEDAFRFAAALTRGANAVRLSPGARHWEIFERMCREGHVRGNRVTDAYYAALAIEHGCEWITLDGDYARFPGLKWRRPG